MYCIPWSMRPTLKFFTGLFYVNVIYKSNTESSALSRQCFLWWKETQWVVVVCVFYIFAGFVLDSEKSAGFFFNLFIFNWRIIAFQYYIGLYQTSLCISHRLANFISVSPVLSEGKRWRSRFLCLGAPSSPSAVMVTLHHKPPAVGERTRTPKGPSGPQCPQLTCPSDLRLLPLARLTKAHLCPFRASTEGVPSDWGKWSGYCLKGISEKEDEAFWACWLKVGLDDAAADGRAGSVSWSISSCVRPGLCLCFRLIWVLKWLLLGNWVRQSPTSADICCSVVRRCLTASAYLGIQANVQWSWKEKHSQGHCALSSSCCGYKGIC